MRFKAVKKIIFTALFLTFGFSPVTPSASSLPSFHFNPSPPWKKADFKNVEGSWIIQGEQSHPSITVTFDVTDENLDPKKFDETELISAIETTRAVPFLAFGITQWKIERHRSFRLGKGMVLEIEGHYHGPGDHRVHFIERDYFFGFNSYTIKFKEDVQSEQTKSAHSTVEIEKILDEFKPEAETS